MATGYQPSEISYRISTDSYLSRFTQMKKAVLLLALAGFMALGACSRKTCPAYSSIQNADVSASRPAV